MANKLKSIASFSGGFFYLSNFHFDYFVAKHPYNGVEYTFKTVEHFFQSAKTKDPDEIQRMVDAGSPGLVKGMGRQVKLRPDWEEIKLKVMRDALGYKFAPGTELAGKLLGTGDVVLIEGNTWGDKYWGVDDETGRGENWLGWLLMAQRAYLRGLK